MGPPNRYNITGQTKSGCLYHNRYSTPIQQQSNKPTRYSRNTTISKMSRKGEPMADNTQEKLSFFEYMALAKQQLQSIQAQYPELIKLSPREIEVFAYLLTDKTQEEIAKELFISSSSVHFHCKNIYKKLEVSGRRQILIRYKDL